MAVWPEGINVMPQEFAATIWTILGIYAALGFVFALVFVTFLIKRVSSGARTAAPLQFRMIIFPACVALWPLLLVRSLFPAPKEAGHETPA